MAQTFTLTLEEYEALVALATRGMTTADEQRALDAFTHSIEKNNGVTRYNLWVQWQEADYPLPPTTSFPEVWPPEMRQYITRVDRPIAKSDVEAVLVLKATNPVNVLVTKDPGAIVGWVKLEDMFV